MCIKNCCLHCGGNHKTSVLVNVGSQIINRSFEDHVPVMLSPRGQVGLEANILSSASKNCPRFQPLAFVLGMSSNCLFWPRENECNDGTGSHCEFAMIINQSYLLGGRLA